MSKAGAAFHIHIPDNKQWHTVKWKIADAQFVGMYGFNFTFNSDGDRYNKYAIQNVTVTKLPVGR
jgi:hypothetical protein